MGVPAPSARGSSRCARAAWPVTGRPAWAIRLLFGEMTAQRGRLHGRDRKAGTRPPRAALHLGLQRTESTCATSVVARQQRSGAVHVEKCLTTPADPSVGILEGLRPFGAIDPEHVARTRRIAHATPWSPTRSSSARARAPALLTTRGFRDVLELRRHVRVTTCELWADPPAPLVPRHLRIPIDERTCSDGTVLRRVPREEIEAAVALMRAEGVGSVAIAFLHSYVNMIEIGAGGGSIAGINSMDLVQVGPESAGADPGPTCYGRGGTRPTVTDADLLLGYLDPDSFAGGSMRLD